MSSSSESLTQAYVADVFHHLEVKGKGADFVKFVADDVDWLVKGSHPVAGKYNKAEFQVGAISRINKGLANPPLIFKVNSIIVGGEWAVVEMQAVDAKAKAGWDFDNHYCWVCRFQKGIIVQVRAYVDSVLVTRVITEAESQKA